MRCNFIYILLILIISVSCKKENLCDCFKSTGKEITSERDVSNFTAITVKDKINVILTQGPVFEVKVEAGANLQSLIKTTLSHDTLKIENKNRCNWVRGYKHKITVYITAPNFNYVNNNGLGTISNTGEITQDSIKVRLNNSGDIKLNLNTNVLRGGAHGNGDLYLSGVSNRLEYDYVGTNYLYAGDLKVISFIYLHSVTLGKSFINAPENGQMDIKIDQAGNIYYKGNPAIINLTRNNKGDLIKE